MTDDDETQAWTEEKCGVIEAVDDESFVARLTSPPDEDQRAEFGLRAVSPEDRALVIVGARFTWTVGVRAERGVARKFSEFKFLPEAVVDGVVEDLINKLEST